MNLNQARMFGLSVCDDPWDVHGELGADCQHVFVPFETEGMNVCFELRVLTDWELIHLLVMQLTVDMWNPATAAMKGARNHARARDRLLCCTRCCGLRKWIWNQRLFKCCIKSQ